MCYYCRYLAHEKSKRSIDHVDIKYGQYVLHNKKYRQIRSCDLSMILRLMGMTIFFVMLNVTIVLSQSSQVQQQKDSSSKILEVNARGKFSFFLFA